MSKLYGQTIFFIKRFYKQFVKYCKVNLVTTLPFVTTVIENRQRIKAYFSGLFFKRGAQCMFFGKKI